MNRQNDRSLLAPLERRRLMTPCQTDDQLHAWVKLHLDIDIPRRNVCAHHDAPFEYLRSSYFEPGKDLVVWAPRGGGKTRLGAVATLLDLLHKPGVSVRILGGSVEQSLKMWEHLVPDIERWAADRVMGRMQARKVAMENGSLAAVLTQSQRAVRGLRVQKLRCDEVELFDENVWQAAQLVTRSMKLNRPGRAANAGSPAEPSEFADIVAGTVEALSTLHAPYGLMSRVVETAEANGTKIVRWCILDVLERCPANRVCATCPLWDDCRGVAKTQCNGFVKIDDAIAMKARVGRDVWDAEMLCKRPSVRGCVFPMFSIETHVREDLSNADPRSVNDDVAPRRWSSVAHRHSPITNDQVSLAIDFGFANPFVCLWIVTTPTGVTHVIEEYVQSGQTITEHLFHLARRPWGGGTRGMVVACDPAGNGRNDQTGRSSIDALKEAGYRVKARPSRIVDGLDKLRGELQPASGPPRLLIHARCKRLIKALRSYHYPADGGELPVKDGEHDHLIDALRYHYVNKGFNGGRAIVRNY